MEIIYAILDSISDDPAQGTNITRLQQDSRLSWRNLRSYLTLLKEKGLIRASRGPRGSDEYSLTTRGEEVRAAITKAMKELGELK